MITGQKVTYSRGSNAFIIENNRKIRQVTIVSCAGGLYKVRFEDGAGTCVRASRIYADEEAGGYWGWDSNGKIS